MDRSTDGKLSPLTIVIPLADKDCCEIERGDEVLLEEDDKVAAGMIGRLKHPSNSSCERTGCHGGSDRSEIIEKILPISSSDKIPS